MTGRVVISAALAVLAAGCGDPYPSLPENPEIVFPRAPVQGETFAWRLYTEALSTYWGLQRLEVRAQAVFPKEWREPNDEAWTVKAVNQEGKAVPFLGVLYPRNDDRGDLQYYALPGFNLQEIPDGLFLFIESQAKLGADKRLAEVRPVLHIREIRRHGYWPYWVRFSMVPEQDHPLTPSFPPSLPENPQVALPQRQVEGETLAWRLESEELSTCWGAQRLEVSAQAVFPKDWREPNDELWTVKALNHEGKRLPFLGVYVLRQDEAGKPRYEARPGLDPRQLPDGLYLYIESQAKLGPNGRVSEVRPILHLRELLNHRFGPYWMKLNLVPVQDRPLTPAPPALPSGPPKGTRVS